MAIILCNRTHNNSATVKLDGLVTTTGIICLLNDQEAERECGKDSN